MDTHDHHAQYRIAQLLEEEKQRSQNLILSRDISRKTVFSIITLSAAIIGATFTLYSLENVGELFDTSGIFRAWVALSCTIAIGLLYLLIDGRALYLETWERAYDSEGGVTPSDIVLKHLARKTLIIALLFPGYRDTAYSKVFALNKSFEDFRRIVAYNLRRLRSYILTFEFLVYAVFITGLILLMLSAR